MPEDKVFILAGLKRPPPAPVEEEREAVGILRSLPSGARQTAMTILRALADEQAISTPVGVFEEQLSHKTPAEQDDTLIRELVEEFRQVPDEWKPVVVEQTTRIRQIASGEQPNKEEGDEAAIQAA